MRRKLTALLLCLVLLLSILVGCGTKNAKSETKAETNPGALGQKVTMNMLMTQNPQAPEPSKVKFFQRMEDKFNIHWNIQAVTVDTLTEKKTLLLASGDYPDVFFKANIASSEEITYGEQGIFIPLQDLINKYAPNIKALFDKNPDLRKAVTTPSGKIYTLPYPGTGGSQNHFYLNKTWLDVLGLKEPQSIDDFYKILVAFKNGDPNKNGKNDEIPLTFTGGAGAGPNIRKILPYFGILSDDILTSDGKTISTVVDKPEYKEFLRTFAKFWKEGLIDKDSFTQTGQQVTAKAQNKDAELVGCFYTAGAHTVVGNDRTYDYVTMIPWKDKNGKQLNWPGAVPAKGTFAITDKCKYPEAAVRWADYFYSEEGAKLSWCGVEGEDYQMRPDGTWEFIIPQGMNVNQVRPIATIQGAANVPGIQPAFWKKLYDPMQMRVDEERVRVRPFDKITVPPLYVNENDQKALNSISADISPYIDQYLAKVITGELNLDNTWDDYVKKLNDMGLQKFINYYKTAYDQYNKN